MSASSSPSSLSPSPSPRLSPHASHIGPPSLERLVDHFVYAKRSLSAISQVSRANELVTSSRSLLEEIAVLNARNEFGKRGLEDQADTLDGIEGVFLHEAEKVSADFATTLANLDKAHLRLEQTLKTLGTTIVGSRARQQGELSFSEATRSGSRTEGNKTLYDFIDEASHEDILSSLRRLIDSYHGARADLDSSMTGFTNSLRSINHKISNLLGSSELPDQGTVGGEPSSNAQQLFRNMEDHATAMASLLENLVKHYDLCVNALKHTEGGSEAAKVAVQSAEELTKGTPGVEESLYRKTAAEPISDEDRKGMLDVLEKDALEVEDVLVEIRDRAKDMEEQYQTLYTFVGKARLRNKILREVLDAMHEIRSAIPAHRESKARFGEAWQDIHIAMQSKTRELADLSVFYEQFLSGYGKLLREVERRSASEAQMRRVAEKARREIERIYDADRSARDKFMEDVGEYLPRDLGLWHGLEVGAPRWQIRAVLDEEVDVRQDL